MNLCLLVCSHNGSSLLGETIRHIRRIENPDGVAWELVLVDNASRDATAEMAETLLGGARFPYRVLNEPLPGKMNALRTGIHATDADLISIIDDDNWISPDWVAKALEKAAAHPKVGVFGSHNEPVFESAPPPWFDRFKSKYACGAQSPGLAGDDGECEFGAVFGAGMTFRKRIWTALEKQGFWFMNDCRPDRFQSSAEDTEFTLAACRLGWRVMFCPDLRLRHYMTKGRLNWPYLLRLVKASGLAVPGIDPYFILNDGTAQTKRFARLRQSWLWQAASKLRRLARHSPLDVFFPHRIPEGEPLAVAITMERAALVGVLRERSRYNRYFQQVKGLLPDA